MTGERRYLGKDTEFSGLHLLAVLLLGPLVLFMAVRKRVYRVDGALEVDEDMGYEFERRRVYFDDVLAVTYHRILEKVFLVGMGFCVALFGLIGWGVLSDGETTAAAILFGVAAFFLAMGVLRIIVRVEVITIYGRRTRARLKFGWAKARARRTFDEIVSLVRARQAEAAAAMPAPAPPAVPAPPGSPGSKVPSPESASPPASEAGLPPPA